MRSFPETFQHRTGHPLRGWPQGHPPVPPGPTGPSRRSCTPLSPDERTLYVVDSCPVPGGNRKILGIRSRERRLPQRSAGRDRLCSRTRRRRDGGRFRRNALHRRGNSPAARSARNDARSAGNSGWSGPTGEVLGRIPVVEDVLTNVTFGGEDLKTLYVTAGKTLFSCRIPFRATSFIGAG